MSEVAAGFSRDLAIQHSIAPVLLKAVFELLVVAQNDVWIKIVSRHWQRAATRFRNDGLFIWPRSSRRGLLIGVGSLIVRDTQ